MSRFENQILCSATSGGGGRFQRQVRNKRKSGGVEVETGIGVSLALMVLHVGSCFVEAGPLVFPIFFVGKRLCDSRWALKTDFDRKRHRWEMCPRHDAGDGQQPSNSIAPPFPSIADDFATSQEVVVIAAKNAALGVAQDLRAKQVETGREQPGTKVAGGTGSIDGGSVEL